MSALRHHGMSSDVVFAGGDDRRAAPRLKRRSDFAPADGSRAAAKREIGPALRMLVHIRADERVYVLRGPIAVMFENLEDGTVFASHPKLPVYGYGEGAVDALEAFGEMFDHQFRVLVEGPADDLAPRALEVREQLRGAVADVLVDER